MCFAGKPDMRLPLLLASLFALSAVAEAEDILRVAGSGALVLPFINAAPALKKQDVELRIIGDSNTPTAILGVGSGQCEMAVSTRRLLPSERAYFPDRSMTETIIGYQALVFCVSNDVWSAGVRSLSKGEIMRVYEGKLKNWKQLGGPDRPIKFFNPEQGKGIWEFFAAWLYGDMRKAPGGLGAENVASPEEGRNLVEFSGGSLAILPPSRAETPGVHGLAMRDDKGALVRATPANVRNGSYPAVRPVVVVTAYRPSGGNKKAIDFLLSAEGQEIVRRSEMVSVTGEETQ